MMDNGSIATASKLKETRGKWWAFPHRWMPSRRTCRLAGWSLASLLAVISVVGYYLLFIRVTNGGLDFQNALRIPTQLQGEEVDGRKRFRLVVQDGKTEFLPARNTSTRGVNGSYLGPTLRVQRGDLVNFEVVNQLDELTTMHWHGMHVPAQMDGTPHQPIDPGESWTASFEVDQQAATLWYHPHPHGQTGRQTHSGIAGLLIVDDQNSDSLEIPKRYGIDDFPLVLQDRRFDDDGEFVLARRRGAVYGDTLLVNGTFNPHLEIPARLVRFRVLNGSNARTYYLGFSDHRSFHQIATDGGFLEHPEKIERLTLAPGERAEILVDCSDGESVRLKSFPEAGLLQTAESFFDGVGNGHFDVLQLHPVAAAPVKRTAKLNAEAHAGGTNDDAGNVQASDSTSRGSVAALNVQQIPKKLNQIVRLDPSTARKRTMTLGGPVRRMEGDVREAGVQRGRPGRGRFGFGQGVPINGKLMDMHRIDERVRLGDTEVWEIHNRTGQTHPFHIHLVQFQLVDRDGVPASGSETGWKDTVVVHPGERVRIIMSFERYADATTPYMYHCHIMEHEDAGMMGQFVVVDEPEELSSVLQQRPTVVAFIVGFECQHCYEQVKKFDASLSSAGIGFAVVSPQCDDQATEATRRLVAERMAEIDAPILSDKGSEWSGWCQLLHREGPAHGTVLLDHRGEVVWQFVEETPYDDVEALVKRARSFSRERTASRNHDTITTVSARQIEAQGDADSARSVDRF